MKIKIIAFDLDGTLLRSDKTISERTLKALEQAGKKGILLVPTTGRNYEGLPTELKEMPFIRYTIEMNGAFVYDTWEKKGLYRAEVGKETSTRMFSYMKTLPVAISCYQNRQAWMEKEAWENLEEYAPCQEQYPTMKRVHAPLENVTEAIFQQGDTLPVL